MKSAVLDDFDLDAVGVVECDRPLLDAVASPLCAASVTLTGTTVPSATVRASLGDLVVIEISSAWASRLRYETDALLAAARNMGLSPTACRVRVSQA